MNTAEFKLFSALGHVRACVEEKPKPMPQPKPQIKTALGRAPRYQRRDMRASK
jgi:hypothetical protein